MKTIVKTFMLAVVMTAIGASAVSAQEKEQRVPREELAERQAQYIANQLALDDNTLSKFVETYCAAQKEVWAIGPGEPQPKKRENMTEEEVGKALQEEFASSQKLLDIRKKYYAEYSKFLTQKQIQRVYDMEKQMRERLSKQRKQRNSGPQNRPEKRPEKRN